MRRNHLIPDLASQGIVISSENSANFIDIFLLSILFVLNNKSKLPYPKYPLYLSGWALLVKLLQPRHVFLLPVLTDVAVTHRRTISPACRTTPGCFNCLHILLAWMPQTRWTWAGMCLRLEFFSLKYQINVSETQPWFDSLKWIFER